MMYNKWLYVVPVQRMEIRLFLQKIAKNSPKGHLYTLSGWGLFLVKLL